MLDNASLTSPYTVVALATTVFAQRSNRDLFDTLQYSHLCHCHALDDPRHRRCYSVGSIQGPSTPSFLIAWSQHLPLSVAATSPLHAVFSICVSLAVMAASLEA